MSAVLASDAQFNEYAVMSTVTADGDVQFNTVEGWSICATPDPGFVMPEPGDILRIYGRGIGFASRGICWRKPDSTVLNVAYYLTPEEGEARDEAYRAKLQAEHEARMREPIPPTGHPVYEWTADMGQISGFGSGYEAACRKMVVAGMEWLNANPGLTIDELKSGGTRHGEFENAVMAPCPDCSGAMLGAAKNHAAFIWTKGWGAYCESMRSREKS